MDNDGLSALMHASRNGHDTIVELLIESGPHIHQTDKDECNALIYASSTGSGKIVELLIKSGADIKAIDKGGLDALMHATNNGHETILEILFKSGADVHHTDKDGCSALILASRNRHNTVLELLIKNGEDIDMLDNKGLDAIMHATKNGHDEIVEILIESGSDIHHTDKDGCNALIFASRNGHDKIFEMLIKNGADINHSDTYGRSALMKGSRKGHNRIVELLFKSEVAINQADIEGCNALIFASRKGRGKIVGLLIKRGADINLTDKYGCDALIHASKNGHDKIVELLIKSGADINRIDKRGMNALIDASDKGHYKIVEFLMLNGADINRAANYGMGALMHASKNGHDKIVELLIKSGADINHVDMYGTNAVIVASKYGHDKIVELFLKNGADNNKFDKSGCDALMDAPAKGHVKIIKSGADISKIDNTGRDALMYALAKGHDNIVELLMKNGADININDKGYNDILINALDKGHVTIVELLIKRRVDFNLTDKDGRSALMAASGNGLTTIVELLIKCGADINQTDKNGMNALFYALEKGQDTIIEILVENGADINSVDLFGVSALMEACMKGLANTALFLIKKGANVKLCDQNGWDALLFASQNGLDEIVQLILKTGGDFNRVNRYGLDALMLAAQNEKNRTVQLLLKSALDCIVFKPNRWKKSKNTSVNFLHETVGSIELQTYLTTYLSELVFLALKKESKSLLEIITSFADEHSYMTYFARNIKILSHHCLTTLNQGVQNDTNNELSTSTIRAQNHADFRNFKRSIDCYVKIVLFCRNNQTPSYDVLKEFVCDVMLEFSNMRDFDALHFFICQKCLKTIYSALNAEDKLKFLKLLFNLNYAEKTMQFLQDEHLLDTTAPYFSLSLIRDMLSLLWGGSHHSSEFALQLAEKNIIVIFTDCLTSIKEMQNSHTLFITKNVIAILHNIARRGEAKKYFTNNIIFEAVLSLKTMYKQTRFTSHLLLLLIEEECGAEKEAIENVKRSVKESLLQAVRGNRKSLYGFPLSELLQGLGKFTEQEEDLKEIIPLLPRLTEILKNDDTDEHLFTTKCIRELSRIPEVSRRIIIDEDLSDLLNKSLSLGNKDITANVHSARWRSGLATGKTDILVSDEFPKEFRIDPTTLASGAFGSVHFVVDIYRPEDIQFVAKKTLRKVNDADKCRDTFQQEASILISLKHERIVQFHGFQKTETELFLFLEFVKMGTLSAFVKQHARLNEVLTRRFTIQILEGVTYLHENKIVHLDIKGNNILMADEANIKLTDFGLSTILIEEKGVEAERGTTRYMAPEMINCPDGRIFRNACSLDIWSVGSTVVEMVTGVPPNSTTASVNVLFKRANLEKPKYNLPVESSIYLQQFLEKTLRPEAAERPSAETLLKEDAFVTGYI
ncbi:uncharacterized protein LOC131943608 [Physella acuta]|uniref:uncharacterized protein LOC131943608 n=1 Tax=Physella acuta TaxID=109671 RepID=UPI0027DD811A|nr:uncharacterized protein LOC131943608 [Physella acuta]